MRASEHSLSAEQFYSELANRFFHTNSYFYHCIKNELDTTLQEAQNGHRQEYLLLGNLFDFLVSADNTVSELDRLKQIHGFVEFIDKLKVGIGFFRETELDAGGMRIEIEGLAHSLFNSILLAIQDRQNIAGLCSLLGVQMPAENNDQEESRKTEEIKRGDDLNILSHGEDEMLVEDEPGPFLPAAENFDEDLHDIEDNMILDLPSEPSDFDKIQQSLDIREEQTDDIDYSLDLTSVDIEELEDLHTPGLESNTFLDRFENNSDALQNHEPDARTEEDFTEIEPESEIETEPEIEAKSESKPELEIENRLESYLAPETEDAAGEDPVAGTDSAAAKMKEAPSHDPEIVIDYFCTEIRSQIVELDRVLVQLRANPTSDSDWVLADELLESMVMTSVIYGFEAFEQITAKARKLIARTREESADGHARAVIVLTKTRQMLSHFLDNGAEKIEAKLVNQFTARLVTPSLANATMPAVKAGATQNSNPRTEEPAADLTSQVKLPGEDDEEVKSLIAQINREKQAQNSQNGGSVEKTTSNRVTDGTNAERLKQFRRMSEIYFNSIDEALARLLENGQSRTAFEDLDVAANALYGVCLRLKLPAAGELPDALLTLIKHIQATNSALSQNDVLKIRQVFQKFRARDTFEGADNEEYREMVGNILALNNRIRQQALNSDKQSQSSAAFRMAQH